MAKKKKNSLSNEQIIALLGAGGSTKDVANPIRVLLALAQNPQMLSTLRQSATQKVDEYSQFDPTYEYDPSTNVNQIELRYKMLPSNYQPLIKAWFDTARKYGGQSAQMTLAGQQLRQDETLGLTRSERDSIVRDLENSTEKFMNAEAARQKAQYSSFVKLRKEKGLTSFDPTVASEQYLSGKTGVSGLTQLPTSIDELAKQKTDVFRKAMLARGKSEKQVSEMADLFSKTFVSKAKEKKISPAMFGLSSVLKKNIFGG